MIQSVRAAILLPAVLFGVVAEAEDVDGKMERHVTKCRDAWVAHLTTNCKTGDSEQKIRQLMEGKYRDSCHVRRSESTYEVVFLVDDFHQIKFPIIEHSDPKLSGLLGTPTIEPKSQWMRHPSGEVTLILTPREAELRASAEVKALEYVVMTSKREKTTLKVLRGSTRSNDGTWEVIVALNSDQFDPPHFHVAVSDDGHVSDWKPSNQ